jgi:hypothetical protein
LEVILNIDTSFVDLDLESAAAAANRLTGYLEFDGEQTCRSYKDSGSPTYTESQIKEYIKIMEENKTFGYSLMTFAHDQDGEGSCVYNAAAHAYENIYSRQFGPENCIRVSPMSGYRNNARGPNSGSMVPGAIKWLEEVGLLPSRDDSKNVEKFEHTHPDVGWRYSFQDGWKTTAKMFRAQEWFWVENRLEWYSAIINGFDCVGGRKGHAVNHCGLTLDGRTILSIYANSWGSWGDTLEVWKGKQLRTFGYDSPGLVDQMCDRSGWCMRTVLRPGFLRHMQN